MTGSTPAPYAAALVPGMEAFLAVAQTVPLVPDTIANHRALVASFTPPLAEQIAGRPITATEVTITREGFPDLIATVLSRTGSTATNRAGILSIHGGGMLLGDRFFGLDDALHLVDTYDVVAITPEYRLAPEHPAPAQVEDCYSALVWLAEHASDLGVDPHRVAVMGFSAGGGLTAGTALLARERGGPEIAACLMNAPMLDPGSDTVSARHYEHTGAWPRTYNVTAWEAILAGSEATESVAPALAESLTGFPRPTSKLAVPRCFATKQSSSRRGSMRQGCPRSCRCGMVPFTGSPCSRRALSSPMRRHAPVSSGSSGPCTLNRLTASG